jgi:ankyrin repeat protein
MAESDLFLLFLSSETVKSDLFIYTAGFGTGAGRNVFFFLLESDLEIPGYFGDLKSFKSLSALKLSIREVYSLWKKQTKIENAKNELNKMDIMCTSEDMAIAASEGNIKALKLFLNAGFSPNTKNKKGVSLLSLAIRNGHRMMIPLLLKNGADVNLTSDDTGNTPLMDASAKSNKEMVSDLINAGSELDTISKIGQTSLMLAVNKGNPEITELLIRAGADANIKDNLGMTAKQYAALFKRKEIIDQIDRVSS